MNWKFEKELEEKRITEAKRIINLLKEGKIKKFGLPDIQGSFCGEDAYFPCEFIEVIDYDKGIIKIYENSINKYHITEAWDLVIADDI